METDADLPGDAIDTATREWDTWEQKTRRLIFSSRA
jgi:hypothetical protein